MLITPVCFLCLIGIVSAQVFMYSVFSMYWIDLLCSLRLIFFMNRFYVTLLCTFFYVHVSLYLWLYMLIIFPFFHVPILYSGYSLYSYLFLFRGFSCPDCILFFSTNHNNDVFLWAIVFWRISWRSSQAVRLLKYGCRITSWHPNWTSLVYESKTLQGKI